MSEVIRVAGLGKRFRLGPRHGARNDLRVYLEEALRKPFRRSAVPGEGNGYRHIWALRDVSFSVNQGEVVGLVGPNGAGKSVLLKVLSRITKPTEGYARVRGRVGALLDVGAGFHPDLTGRENIYLGGAVLGMNRASVRRKLDDIVCLSGLEKFLHVPIKQYSSGMRGRLSFAVAANLETQIMLVDEVLSVADDAFREMGIARLHQAALDGKTIILVSHDLGTIERVCHRAVLLRGGRVALDDTVPRVVREYRAEPSSDLGRGSEEAEVLV